MHSGCVSIIVPVYKVEKYINRCVDSLLSQTYKDIEIILVDDGSPDTCPQICDFYKDQDSRVKVIHKLNGGLSDARNAGIKIASGKYITFVDSDDYLHSDCIELLLKGLVGEQKSVSIVRYHNFYENQIVTQNISKDCQVIVLTKEDACLKNFSDTAFRTAWGKLYTRDMIKDNLFPKGKLHEDEFTTYKLLYEAESISYIPQKLYFYFQRSDGIMGTIRSVPNKVNFDAIEAFEQRCAFYLEKKEGKLFEKASWNLILISLLLLQKYKSTPNFQIIRHRIKDDLRYLQQTKKVPLVKLFVWNMYTNMICLFSFRQWLRKMYKSF